MVGNYNAVIASYERARQAALKRGRELRFRRHEGTGRFTKQSDLSSDRRPTCLTEIKEMEGTRLR